MANHNTLYISITFCFLPNLIGLYICKYNATPLLSLTSSALVHCGAYARIIYNCIKTVHKTPNNQNVYCSEKKLTQEESYTTV